MEIQAEAVTIGRQLGSGYYGYVRKGTWNTSNGRYTVAVKFFYKSRNCDKEARIMRNLNHPNVVTFYGTTFIAGKKCIVMEFMNHGTIEQLVENMHYTRSDLKTIKLLLRDVASAMCYLEDNGYVHRDLAARNVLIETFSDGALQAKICDFGLTKNYDFYGTLAFQLTPPEVFEGRHHSIKSDVWAFGILMWDILSPGQTAFGGMTRDDIEQIVCQENVWDYLEEPGTCPRSWYRLMKLCWLYDPDERISFGELKRRLPSLPH